MHQKTAKIDHIMYTTLFCIVHISMGQSRFSDSYISDKLKAQNYNIMDPISALIHRDQFLMSSYGALLCFSRTFSEKYDTLHSGLVEVFFHSEIYSFFL